MKHEHIFIVVISIMFCVLTAVFILFPRSTFSELERRELAVFPEFDRSRLADGSYTRDVSAWFSDTEPMRDRFMLLHLKLKDIMALKLGADSDYVAFHAAEPIVEEPSDEELERRNRDIGEYENTLTEDAHTKVANAGIVILGSGPEVRALMAYGGNEKGGGPFADAVNRYKKHFGKDVNVYCMVIPTAGEYYAPAKVRNRIKPQLPTIRNIYSLLSDSVKAVDVYSVLGNHASEPIYLRTDHHWSPLGAYYAAEKFAEVAKVPFRKLDEYDRKVVPGFVGTMYGYSKDISVKNAPEDFVYYTPRDTTYEATFVNFALDKSFKITGESAPHKAPFFRSYPKSPGMAYSSFMGGDAMIVKVRTGVGNGRRLAIMKDSVGNAVPAYLFGSFEEVHVLDFRYFPRNVVKYVRDNGITDFVFINNIFNAYSDGVAKSYREMLTHK